MGKGRIVSAQGEGRYTLEILEDRTRAESQRAIAVAKISEIDDKLTEMDQTLADWQTEVDLAAQVQNEEIADYQQAVEDGGNSPTEEQKAVIEQAREAMAAAAENLIVQVRERDAARTKIRLLKVQKLAAQARIERIDALPPLRQIDAWCADYTEDLSGEVATAEVPGEIGQVVIKPGFADDATWSASVDGAIQPALSGTPASVFYNLAMMPGWQKWRPTFRIATISNIDNDMCSISLDVANSSQQGLNVNAQGSYSGVPIMYMDCNGDAFEDGDRVMVAFSGNTDAPMVVGFEQEPRECGITYSEVFDLHPLSPIPDRTYNGEDSNRNPPQLNVAGYGVHALRDDVPASSSSSRSGRKWRIDASSTVTVTDYAYEQNLEGTYREITLAEIQEGDPLVAICNVEVNHETVCVGTFASNDAFLWYVKSVLDQSSIIDVDGQQLDLSTMGIRIAGADYVSLSDPDFDGVPQHEFINSRHLDASRLDDRSIGITKDSRGVIRLNIQLTTAPVGLVLDFGESFEPYVNDRVASYAKAPDGSLFRVQAQGFADSEQMPDYASLPVDIEQDEGGNWVPVF